MIEIILPTGEKGLKAEYIEQFVSEYKGNPLIEALPQVYSTEQVIEKLAIYPTYNESERDLDKQYRVHIIQRVFQCFQPLMIHLDLESKISRMIRQGYLARNPFDPKYVNRFVDGYDLNQNISNDLNNNELFRSSGSSLTIIGMSGIGKTTAINRIISLYPQIIIHSEYKNTKFSMFQLTYLKIDCPHDGSLKGLCVDFFLKIDALLGTNYYEKFGQSRLSVNTMLPVMAKIALNTGLGILIIDEIQNLNAARSGGADRMLNFFVKLSNLGIPNITIGTPSATPVLQSQFRQARRGSGQGSIFWDRLIKDDSWDLLLNAIWNYQWTRKTTTLSEEMSDMLYNECQGITDIAVKLFIMSQIRAIMSGTEEITSNLIKQTADENFKLVKPMLDALKTGDVRKVAKYEDISTEDTDFLGFYEKERSKADLEKKIEEIKQIKNQKGQEGRLNKKEESMLKFADLNIDTERAEKIIDKTLDEKYLEIDYFADKAIQQISTKDSKKRKTRIMKCIDENDVRNIVNDGRKELLSAHDSLHTKGTIKDFTNDIFRFGDVI